MIYFQFLEINPKLYELYIFHVIGLIESYMNLFVKYRWLLVLLVGIKMKKTIDNHKTIFTNYFHSPTISNTTNKISYLPSLNFNFEQMLQNRVKADNIDVPKSIFVLKYKLKK